MSIFPIIGCTFFIIQLIFAIGWYLSCSQTLKQELCSPLSWLPLPRLARVSTISAQMVEGHHHHLFFYRSLIVASCCIFHFLLLVLLLLLFFFFIFAHLDSWWHALSNISSTNDLYHWKVMWYEHGHVLVQVLKFFYTLY